MEKYVGDSQNKMIKSLTRMVENRNPMPPRCWSSEEGEAD
jgi:hypothetical protein